MTVVKNQRCWHVSRSESASIIFGGQSSVSSRETSYHVIPCHADMFCNPSCNVLPVMSSWTHHAFHSLPRSPLPYSTLTLFSTIRIKSCLVIYLYSFSYVYLVPTGYHPSIPVACHQLLIIKSMEEILSSRLCWLLKWLRRRSTNRHVY